MTNIYIVGGQPGSGKSTFASHLDNYLNDAKYIAQDTIKEFLFDLIGFENLKFKESLVELGRSIFYQCCEYCVQNNIDIIIDYPFSELQLDFLNELSNNYHVSCMTFVLYGNNRLLYQRIIERENIHNRHSGHFSSRYPTNEKIDYKPISYKQYLDKYKERDYSQFKYGNTIYIDTTNIDEENYLEIIKGML